MDNQLNTRLHLRPGLGAYLRKHLLFLAVIAATAGVSFLQSCERNGKGGDTGIVEGKNLMITTLVGDFISMDDDGGETKEGPVTGFVSGDRMGIIAVKGGSRLHVNVSYVFTEGKGWQAEYGDAVEYHEGATYIAYYPYSDGMNSAGTVDDVIQTFSPASDQSSAEGFRASDLLVWSGSVSGSPAAGELNIEFVHGMAMVMVQPEMEESHTGISDVNVKVLSGSAGYRAFGNGDMWYALIRPQSAVRVEVSYKYNGQSFEWDNSDKPLNVVGNRYAAVSYIDGDEPPIDPPDPPDPSDYYSGAYGKYGESLRSALFNIIKGHTVISYKNLYTVYVESDIKLDGTVWDMYSDVPGGTPPYTYVYSSKRCGNYSKEGDCYNREHSMPQSWFNERSPMVSDLFHVYPTDGYVNGRRSNYPFGEVSKPSWTSLNGSKVGNNSYSGYSGTVFEPIDEYKGDFARTYFYMVTRYYDTALNSGNGANVITYSGGRSDLKAWAVNMLIEWHTEDPVSKKETDRNNVVYIYQKNRNPYIDHPELVDHIWGSKKSQPWTN